MSFPKDRIQIVDGSFGFQIRENMSKEAFDEINSDHLWSSRALQSHPDAVIKTHMDYIKAGCDIIETNTYQASIPGFMKYLELSEEDSVALMKKSVLLAKEAVERCEGSGLKRPLIAGAIGPYGAFLHNASEYDGNYLDFISLKQLEEFHKPRIDALIEAGVDLLAIETMPGAKEAKFLVEYIKKYPHIKAWVSFTCKTDGLTTCHGDSFRTAALSCYEANRDQVIAIGVNCVPPHIVGPLLKDLNLVALNRVSYIVYPNSGESYDGKHGWVDEPERLEDFIPTWLDLGVKYIGGCCRVCANYTGKIKKAVEKWEQARLESKKLLEDNFQE